jgi:membrane protein
VPHPRLGGLSLEAGLHRLDAAQQRRRWSALPVAVLRTFLENNGGQMAGLVAYYGFFSLFPLLLVLVTVLGIVLHGDPDLQSKIINSSLASFPVIGPQIRNDVKSLNGGVVPLVLGAVAALWAGLAVTNATRTAQDRMWGVPAHRRTSFLDARLRGLAQLALFGGVNVITTVLAGFVVTDHSASSLIIALVVSIVLDLGLFIGVFVLLTSYPATVREILPGAILATVVWELLQHLGGYLVQDQLHKLSATYGLFALVLGTLAWLHIGAQAVLYACALNVVRSRKLWPRPWFDDGATAAAAAAAAQG